MRRAVGLALLAALGAAAPAAGQGARGAGPADTTGVRAGAAPGRFDAPRWVMLRSLAVPGWGQAHNGAWVKAGILATLEVWMGYRILDEERALGRLEDEVNRLPFEDPRRNLLVDEFNARLSRQVGRQWLLAGVVAYALLDAYVDAHFRDFGIAVHADPDGDRGGARVAVRGRF